MKFKKFSESDSWAGSIYAYKNPEVRSYLNSFEMPLKKSYLYLCNRCGIKFFHMEEDGNPKCPKCKSMNCRTI